MILKGKCSFKKKNSYTGTRTRVCRVKAGYPNHLDYIRLDENEIIVLVISIKESLPLTYSFPLRSLRVRVPYQISMVGYWPTWR
jgi:hypothetical protein